MEAADISSDVVLGMQAMSQFTGIQERKLYYLATKKQLPGAFRMGHGWALLKSVYKAEIRARALGATAQSKAG